jgi:uncharacterized membrane protein (DUF485 family)
MTLWQIHHPPRAPALFSFLQEKSPTTQLVSESSASFQELVRAFSSVVDFLFRWFLFYVFLCLITVWPKVMGGEVWSWSFRIIPGVSPTMSFQSFLIRWVAGLQPTTWHFGRSITLLVLPQCSFLQEKSPTTQLVSESSASFQELVRAFSSVVDSLFRWFLFMYMSQYSKSESYGWRCLKLKFSHHTRGISANVFPILFDSVSLKS